MKRLFALMLASWLCAGAAAAGDIVVIVNPMAPGLSKQQLADVYLGRSETYAPIDLAESSPVRADFYQRATGRDLAQVKSTWSRIVFTGRGLPPRELPDAAAVKRAVAANPRAVGYIERAAVDDTVKVVLVLD